MRLINQHPAITGLIPSISPAKNRANVVVAIPAIKLAMTKERMNASASLRLRRTKDEFINWYNKKEFICWKKTKI